MSGQPQAEVPVKSAETSSAPVSSSGNPILGLREEVDRLFDSFIHDWPRSGLLTGGSPLRGSWLRPGTELRMPSIDMSEIEQAYEIKAELPGIEPKDIELILKDDLLTLKGEKRAEREEKRKNYYLQERSRGAFHRVLRLPDDVEPERITTHYADGVLTVTLPKSEQARSRIRRIEIQS